MANLICISMASLEFFHTPFNTCHGTLNCVDMASLDVLLRCAFTWKLKYTFCNGNLKCVFCHGNFTMSAILHIGSWQFLNHLHFLFFSQTWQTYFMDHGKLNLLTMASLIHLPWQISFSHIMAKITFLLP